MMWRQRNRTDEDFSEEIHASITLETDRLIAEGMSPEEARTAARRAFGNVTKAQERFYESRRVRWLDDLQRDVRYASRTLVKSPGFTAASIMTLALGIAATTTVFAFLDALVLNPIPYDEADRMVRMAVHNRQGQVRGGVTMSAAEFAEFLKLDVFDDAIAFGMWDMTLTGNSQPVHVRAGQYSANVFDYYRVSMARGRPFTVDEAPLNGEPHPVVVLSYRFWRSGFGGTDDILGRSIRLDGESFTVVGVAPDQFREMDADVYLPLQRPTDSKNHYGIAARVRQGLDLTAVEASLQSWVERLASGSPGRFVEDVDRIRLVPLASERAVPFRGTLTILMTATTGLLTLGCANVSILLLARAVNRRHEIAVRVALGATRPRLVGQLLVEALVLAMLGGALGVFLTWRGVPAIVNWLPQNYLPRDVTIEIDSTVLVFTTSAAVLTGLLFGLLPALQLSRGALRQAIQANMLLAATSATNKRTHHLIIATQVALSVLLLAGASTALTAFVALTRTRLNFDHEHVLVATLPLAEGRYAEWADRRLFFDRIRERVSSLPGVEDAALSFAFVCCAGPATPPLTPMLLPNRPPTSGIQPATVHRVTSNIFSTLRIPLRVGRIWSEADHSRGATVAVVAQQAASQLWPGQDPIGQRIRLPQLKARQSWETSAPGSDGWLEIIGVVADVPTTGLRQPSRWPVMYVPFTLNLGDIAKLIVRTRGEPVAMLTVIQNEIGSIDPSQPISDTETAHDILRSTGWGREEIVASVLLVVAIVGLVLAGVGLHSVVSFITVQRVREFGIRRALGAGSSELIWKSIKSTMTAVAVGAATGVLLSATVDKLATELTQLRTRDPFVLAAVVSVLLGVAVLASLIPAWRAAHVDPLVALRGE